MTYQVVVRGKMNAIDLNALSPLEISVLHIEQDATLILVHTDQSGLIGFLRHLHSRGITLIAVKKYPDSQRE